MSSKTVLVLVTTPPEVSHSIAAAIVESRTAACVNVIPRIRSVYSWKGKVCDDAEDLLLIKSARERVEALQATVITHHPYELPEFIVVNIDDGLPDYLQWIADSVSTE